MSTFLSRWGDLLAVGLLALHGALAWLTRSVGIGIGNDAPAFLLLARSLSSFSYRDFHVVGAPVHSQYPPGFPALLALLSLPFGENIDLLIAAMIAMSVAALAVVYVCVRSRGGRGLALGVLALSAVNPALVHEAGVIASEMPYLLLTAVTVWAVLRESEPSPEPAPSGRPSIIASAAAVASALMRSIGVTMVGALLLHWLLTRRYRRVLIIAGVSAFTVGAWLVVSALSPVQFIGRSYFADAAYAPPDAGHWITTLPERGLRNVHHYATVALPWTVTRGTVPGTIVDNVVGLLVTVVAGSVGFWVMWKQARFVVLYLACTGVLLLFWPWGSPRFLVPVMPFLLWTGMAGAFRLAAGRRWLTPVPVSLALLIGVIGLGRATGEVIAKSRCDRSAPLVSECFPDAERAFFAAAEFVRDQTPDTAIILTHIETVVAWESSRTVLLVESVDPDPARILGSLRSQGVDYVVLTPLRPTWAQHVPALREVCGELELVEEFYPVTFLLRVPPPSSPPDTNACDAIQRFEREYS
jgi:hypothetical protein